MHGLPRLPWDTEGVFDGVSTFRLDRRGKIYEHQARRAYRAAWAYLGMNAFLNACPVSCTCQSCGTGVNIFADLAAMTWKPWLQVDNVILRDPPMQRSPLFARLNLTPLLQPAAPPAPCPGAWCVNASSSSNAPEDALVPAAASHAHAAAASPADESPAAAGGGGDARSGSSAAGYASWVVDMARREALQASAAAAAAMQQRAAAVQGALRQGGGNAAQTVQRVIANDLSWARSRGLLGGGRHRGGGGGGSGSSSMLQGLRRLQRYSQPPFQT